MASLRLETCSDLALPQGIVAEQIASLLALAVGRVGAVESPRTLLAELLVTLRDRLEEADLAPTAVASQHDISRRTLHYAFCTGGHYLCRGADEIAVGACAGNPQRRP